jgi:hypothetical protein
MEVSKSIFLTLQDLWGGGNTGYLKSIWPLPPSEHRVAQVTGGGVPGLYTDSGKQGGFRPELTPEIIDGTLLSALKLRKQDPEGQLTQNHGLLEGLPEFYDSSHKAAVWAWERSVPLLLQSTRFSSSNVHGPGTPAMTSRKSFNK